MALQQSAFMDTSVTNASFLVNTATTQFALTAVLLLPVGVLRGLSPAAAWAAGPELLVLGVFSTALAFGIQTVAQRFTSAGHAAVVVSAESVFGATAAAVVLGERVTPAGAAGGLLVLAAIALVALGRQPADPGGRRT